MAKIYVVDDDALIGTMVKHILELKNHEVLVSRNSERIAERILENNIDLVLLDRFLFEVDGLDVCFSLKNNASTASIPVIIMSALSGIQKECKNAGATDFIGKPFNIESLFLKTELALNKKAI